MDRTAPQASGTLNWLSFFQKAAAQGSAKAQCNLGICYTKGEGVSQSLTEAAKMYQKAAAQGYAYAQFNLGVCYGKGEGVQQSDAEALKLLQKAAAQGYTIAQQCLRDHGPKLRASGATATTLAGAFGPDKCGNCGAAASRRCTRCKAVKYCSGECQTQHWKQGGHKAVCKRVKRNLAM